MDLDELEADIGTWRGDERTLIRVFLVLFAVIAVAQISYDYWISHTLDLSFWKISIGIGQTLVIAYAITSFILGILFVYRFQGEGIVTFREVLRTMAQVSVVVAAFFTLLLVIDIADIADTQLHDAGGPEMTAARSLYVVGGFALLTFLGTLVAQLVVFIGGFGIIGMIYTFEVGGMPRLIRKVQGITAREDTQSKAIMWFLTIPGALDTDVVLVDEPQVETAFPWERFRTAVGWQVAFGIIIAIYVSLNPWLLRNFTLNQLFRFMSTAFVVIPIIVIPWFIHRRLNSRVKGVNRDFTLYAAMKDRIVRVIIAGGTLLIFLRLALESTDPMDLMVALTSYIFIMVLCIIAFTFIYFNFFENKLAQEVYVRWQEGAPAEEGPGDEDVVEGEGGEVPSVSE